MRRARGRFVVSKQFFVQLFARPQAREHDPDLLLRESVQPDQIACQIDYSYWLAHIQDKDLAATAHARRLQHQLRSLGNRHEESRDLWMRDRHRATLRNLLLE